MQVTWTNCADEMPPDGYKIDIIVRSIATKEPKIISTRVAHLLMPSGNSMAEWTPYTPEKWKELHK